MTLSRPRTTGRVLRGSALGLGLLVAGGITAPAAFAIEGTAGGSSTDTEAASSSPAPLVQVTPEVAATMAPALSGDFGTGKDFTVQVRPYGPVPGDLDLSGAVFRATPHATTDQPQTLAADPDGYTCTTDVHGSCRFDTPWSMAPEQLLPLLLTANRVNASIPAGTYTLTQEQASPGLAVAAGAKDFTLCTFPFGCRTSSGISGVVGNDSLFRTSLVTTVTDLATGQPLACAGYELTGPDYPHDGTPTATSSSASSSSAAADPCASTPAPVTTTAPTTTTAPVTTTAPTTTTTTSTTTAPTTTTSTSTTSTSTTSPSPVTTTTSPSTVTLSPAADVLDLVGEQPETVSYGTQVSDLDGVLVFEGWFIPGSGYLLTPTGTPEGYSPDVTDGFSITTTAAQAAMEEPAAAARALQPLAAGGSAPALPPLAGAATTSASAAGAAATTTAPAASAASSSALAVTGTPVGTIALLGTGLVVLGGGALAAGTISRRRARSDA